MCNHKLKKELDIFITKMHPQLDSAINKLSLDWEEWIILKFSCSIWDDYIFMNGS